MNLSIYAEISRALNISQYGKPNHDSIFSTGCKAKASQARLCAK